MHGMHVHTSALVPFRVLAVRQGADGQLETTEPADPDAFAFEISGRPQILRHLVSRDGRRRTVRMFRLPGRVSGRPAQVSIPLSARVWTVGSLVNWPAAANTVTSTAA